MKKKWSVFILIFFGISFSDSFAEITTNHKFTKDYQNNSGTVTFSHDKHAGTYTNDCYFCHSALKIFGGKVDQLFAHKFCNDCHIKKASLSSSECDFCHTNRLEMNRP